MAKQLMNEAERFLLEHWADAHLLEKSMKDIRVKYEHVCDQVVEAVKEKHAELDLSRVAMTQSWTDGCVGFGRKSWPRDDPKTPSGFWVNHLRLEYLTEKEEEAPYASIWITKESKLDFTAAQSIVARAASELLAAEEINEWTPDEEDEQTLLWRWTASKAKLLAGLLEGDGEAFVKLLLSEFDVMARFVPVLDEVFRDCVPKK
jgi:hypothetical protein